MPDDDVRQRHDGSGGRADPAPEPSDDDEPSVGQVLGTDVTKPKGITQAEPGSPQTGARRDAQGRATAG
jgi:hypothetical protein